MRYTDASGLDEMVPSRVRLNNSSGISDRSSLCPASSDQVDLYLKLRCGWISTTTATVDGDLLARLDGDGNYVSQRPQSGTAGGLFESWIRVTTETRG